MSWPVSKVQVGVGCLAGFTSCRVWMGRFRGGIWSRGCWRAMGELGADGGQMALGACEGQTGWRDQGLMAGVSEWRGYIGVSSEQV